MRPNVLLLHCHDLGRYLGCYGNRTVRSPHLDQLAADGVTFSQAFATAPQCSPSRASLFTGRWPHSTGVMGLTHGDFGWDLHPGERHLAERLGGAGYRTSLVGVHHESRVRADARIAARLGFDEVVTGGLADVVADRAIERLERFAAGDAPFYLQAGFFEPHRLPGKRDPEGVAGFLGDAIEPDDHLGVEIPPYLVDDAGARVEVAELQGAIRHMDAAAGRVLARLDELGLTDNTLVVFTTDHGLALPRAKCTLYDPGLETALIMRLPARGWGGGGTHDALVPNIDIVPTLLDAAGLPSDAVLHGRSLASLLDGGSYRPRTEIFGELTHHDYYDPKRCIRTDQYKLIANFSSAPEIMDSSQSWRPRSTPRTSGAARVPFHPPVELYDLVRDPDEMVDLAHDPDSAGIRDELAGRLASWMRSTGDPLVDGAVTPPLHHRTLAALDADADAAGQAV
ncbi:sulfatase [Streptomyces sp. A7024]|uniref:Sulfatase n=1 Tax=Streptomyces coryli TaxID=1128680 RepID=A0A6G4TTK2_9ACTN|nr:sulfatase [Streptomyces coryli]NGN62428.1 sulfatase [Streptomyces coryli]